MYVFLLSGYFISLYCVAGVARIFFSYLIGFILCFSCMKNGRLGGGGRNFPPLSTPLGVGDLKLWPGVDYEWFIKDASTPIYTC